MTLLAGLSLRPALGEGPSDPRVSLVADLLHVPAYAVLAGCLLLTFGGRRAGGRPSGAAIALTLLVVAAIAIANEWVQVTVPGRFASAGDVVLDMTGATAAVAVLCLPRQRQP